jgi:serine/threonine protein kinase/tetratricopeptide (TPR) repeat protein
MKVGSMATIDVPPHSLTRTTVKSDSTPFEPPGHQSGDRRLIDGRYQLLERLGAGGMAVVYRAHDRQRDTDIALKLMKTELGTSARRRFFREFNTIAGVDHPCCLRAHDIGETDGTPFFTMELHPGQTVACMMGRPVEAVVQLIVDLTLAIDHIHCQGIVHRDIKPSNVMVAPDQSGAVNSDGPVMRAKLTDFGLAKFYQLDSSLTGERGMVGTPAYCAPEQIHGRAIDHRADLYAMGLLAYELLSGGHHPFAEQRGKGINTLIQAQLATSPVPLRVHSPHLPQTLCETIGNYLAKDPEQRPPSAQPLRRELTAAFKITIEDHLEPKIGGSTGPINTFGFVCRKQELEAIDSYIQSTLAEDDADRGTVPTVLVFGGDAGIGKSRLVEEAARYCLNWGFRVYDARCVDGDNSSFHPFIAILRQFLSGIQRSEMRDYETTRLLGGGVQSAEPAELERVLKSYCPELLRIAPEFRKWLPESQRVLEIDVDAQYLYRALASMFVEFSQVRPICLCIDDLQWADHASLQLLKHLSAVIDNRGLGIGGLGNPGHATSAKPMPRPRIAIFCSSRLGESTVTEFLRREQTQSRFAVHRLAPFDSEETRHIVSLRLGCHASQVTESLIASIDSICQGNPFYIAETIRDWQSRGWLVRGSEGWARRDISDESTIPSTVRAAMAARLYQLSETATQLLPIAATIGRLVDIDLMTQIAGKFTPMAVLDAVDELLAHKILLETRTASSVEFSHDLLRELILENLSALRRRTLHREIATTLERSAQDGKRVPSFSVLSHHYYCGEVPQKAFEYALRGAGEAIHALAFQDAHKLLLRAEELASEQTARADRYQLHSLLARTYAADDQFEAAIHHQLVATELADDDLQKARSLTASGRWYQYCWDVQQASKHYVAALTQIGVRYPGSKPALFFWTMVHLGFATVVPGGVLRYLRRRNYTSDEVEIASEIFWRFCYLKVGTNIYEYNYSSITGVAVAKASDDSVFKALAYSKLALLFGFCGLTRVGIYYGRRSLRYAGDHARPDLQSAANSVLAACEYGAGNSEAAIQLLEPELTALRHLRDHQSSLVAHWLRHSHSILGNTDQVIRYGELELEIARSSNDLEHTGYAQYGLTYGYALAGRFDDAKSAADASDDCLSRTQSSLKAIAFSERGFLHLQEGDYAAARNVLRQALILMRQRMAYIEITIYVYPRIIEAMLGPTWADGAGVDRRALKSAKRYLWQARLCSLVFPNLRTQVARVLARVAFAKGRVAKARALFEKAIREAEIRKARFELARACHDIATAFPELSDQHQRASQILKEIGAVLPAADAGKSARHPTPDATPSKQETQSVSEAFIN